MYIITIKKSALKELKNLPSLVQAKIINKIDLLAENPRPDGCKKLVGNSNLWRIREGDYRIVYNIEDLVHIIEIRRIAHRKDIYD